MSIHILGIPRWRSGKEFTCQCRRHRKLSSISGSGKSPEEEMATHSSILAWRIPWTEESGGLQSMGSQRVGLDWVTNATLLLQILKDDAVKVLHSICQQIWKTQQWPQVWKRSLFIPIPKKGNAKECSNYHTVMLISHTSKVMLKILQSRLWQYVNKEFLNVQARFRKGRGTRDQIANIHWIIGKAREFQKKHLLYWLC